MELHEKRISHARTRLLLDFPWFGALSMRLNIVPDTGIKTFNVDGTTMKYNPAFAETLSEQELAGVIAHEVMHCALGHMYRRGNRDHLMFNMAADYAINLELVAAGLTLPKGCLIDHKYAGLASEVIYAQLKREKEQQKNQPQAGNGQGNGKPVPTGEFVDAPQSTGQTQDGNGSSDADGKPQDGTQGQQQPSGQMTETDWKIAAEQAARVANKAGKLPGNIERALQKSRESRTDWKNELREFMEQTVPSDYSWTNPNRRFIHQGIYLPGVVKENFGKLVLAVDTSGSISADDLNAFVSELSALCSELHPESVTIIYCDATIQGIETWDGQDEIIPKPKGGGGTRFQPVFTEISTWEDQPKAVLYFSADLDNSDRKDMIEPEYPVLFVTGMDCVLSAPFGKVIRIEA